MNIGQKLKRIIKTEPHESMSNTDRGSYIKRKIYQLTEEHKFVVEVSLDEGVEFVQNVLYNRSDKVIYIYSKTLNYFNGDKYVTNTSNKYLIDFISDEITYHVINGFHREGTYSLCIKLKPNEHLNFSSTHFKKANFMTNKISPQATELTNFYSSFCFGNLTVANNFIESCEVNDVDIAHDLVNNIIKSKKTVFVTLQYLKLNYNLMMEVLKWFRQQNYEVMLIAKQPIDDHIIQLNKTKYQVIYEKDLEILNLDIDSSFENYTSVLMSETFQRYKHNVKVQQLINPKFGPVTCIEANINSLLEYSYIKRILKKQSYNGKFVIYNSGTYTKPSPLAKTNINLRKAEKQYFTPTIKLGEKFLLHSDYINMQNFINQYSINIKNKSLFEVTRPVQKHVMLYLGENIINDEFYLYKIKKILCEQHKCGNIVTLLVPKRKNLPTELTLEYNYLLLDGIKKDKLNAYLEMNNIEEFLAINLPSKYEFLLKYNYLKQLIIFPEYLNTVEKEYEFTDGVTNFEIENLKKLITEYWSRMNYYINNYNIGVIAYDKYCKTDLEKLNYSVFRVISNEVRKDDVNTILLSTAFTGFGYRDIVSIVNADTDSSYTIYTNGIYVHDLINDITNIKVVVSKKIPDFGDCTDSDQIVEANTFIRGRHNENK